MTSPTVSVIIPVYNTGKYLRTCLDSIVNQTLPHIEIICVNDGSSDDSGAILAEYAKNNSNIIIIEQSNQGLSSSRNNALDRARGQYIAFIDSDDWLRLDALEKLVQKSGADQADMLMFQADIYDEETKDIHAYDYTNFSALLPPDFPLDHFNCHTFASDWRLLWQLPVMVCTVLWRREFIERLHLRFPPRLSFEDNLFFKKALLQAESIAIMPQSFYYYRQRSASITSNRSHLFNDLCTIIRLETDFVFSHVKNHALKRNYLHHGALGHLYWAFWNTSHSDKHNTYANFKKTFFSILSYSSDSEFRNSLPPAFRELAEIMPHADSYESFIQYYSRTADSIADTLQTLDSFYYKPNPGNVGDALIAVSTLDLFEKHNLRFIPFDNLTEDITSYDLVYGGGGACIPDWDALSWLIKLFTDSRIRQCIILPQSFHNCLSLLHVLDERFTIFCRDKESFFYCKTKNHKARFLLADDMALSLKPEKFIARNQQNATFDAKCLKQRINHALSTLPDGRKVLLLIRQDRESILNKAKNILHLYETVDLSALNSDECDNRSSNEHFVQLFLSSINEADIVLTDRLHGAIGAILMKKEVYMLDNSYGKLSNVYAHSLHHRPNVHFLHTLDDFPYWQGMQPNSYSYVQNIVPLKPLRTTPDNYMVGMRFTTPGTTFHVHAEISHLSKKDDIEYRCDPWVRMLIFPMMVHGGTFHIKGTVSRSMLENLEKLVDYWSCVAPDTYHQVSLIPDNIDEDTAMAYSQRKAIVLFSGGVNSMFTTCRHKKALAGQNTLDIQAGLLVTKSDLLPAAIETLPQQYVEKTTAILRDLTINKFHHITTNFHQIPFPQLQSGEEWQNHVHTAYMSACAAFLAPLYSDCLIGSTEAYSDTLKMKNKATVIGSPWFSTNHFQLHIDGYPYSLTTKIALLSKWIHGMEQLHVCGKSSVNCGYCENCIRTNLAFLACGVKCNTLPMLTPAMIENVKSDIITHFMYYDDIINCAKQHGRGMLWWNLQLEGILSQSEYQTKQQESLDFIEEHRSTPEWTIEFSKAIRRFLDTHEKTRLDIICEYLHKYGEELEQTEEWKTFMESFLSKNDLFMESRASRRIKKLNKIVDMLSKLIIFPAARRKFRNTYKFRF